MVLIVLSYLMLMYTLAWVMMKSTAYGGLLMLILLSKIEGIYTFNATNLNQTAVKTITNIMHDIK